MDSQLTGIQKCGFSAAFERVFPRWAAAFTMLALLPAVGLCGKPDLRVMQKKHHNVPVELWSLYCRLTCQENGDTSSEYLGVLFATGRFLWLNGNTVVSQRLSMPKSAFCSTVGAYIAPFARVEHDTTILGEKIGPNSLTVTTDGGLHLAAKTKCLDAEISIEIVKPHVTFGTVFGGENTEKKFDWYLLPRVRVRAIMPGCPDSVLAGEGHFQQFWGEHQEQNSDWLLIHLDSGHDIIVTDFAEDKKNKSWLPGNYLLISYPDGHTRKISEFGYKEVDWFPRENTSPRWPTTVTIDAPKCRLALRVEAEDEEQFVDFAGIKKWSGFGAAEGKFAGKSVNGWAHMSMLSSRDRGSTASR